MDAMKAFPTGAAATWAPKEQAHDYLDYIIVSIGRLNQVRKN
jgi:hypothetical protein